MTQNEHSAPRVKICPRCSSIVAPTEVVASVLNRFDCPSCNYHFVDVCEGACDECSSIVAPTEVVASVLNRFDCTERKVLRGRYLRGVF